MNSFTHKQIPHHLRKDHVLSLPPARSTYYGTNWCTSGDISSGTIYQVI